MERLIQVVEDDSDIRFIVRYILEESSFVVETFENATSFLNRTKKEDVDLVILDVMLPDGNGLELSRNLKADIATSTIPVIIMSAHSRADLALRLGQADKFIQKPFDLDMFLEKVREVLCICGE